MKFYTCQKCLYTFSAGAKPSCCPDCGHSTLRIATPEEIYVRVEAALSEDLYLARHPITGRHTNVAAPAI